MEHVRRLLGPIIELIILFSFGLRVIRFFVRIPAALVTEVRSRKVRSVFVVIVFMLAITLFVRGALILETKPSREILAYNETVRGVYVQSAPADINFYCRGGGGYPGPRDTDELECPDEEEVQVVRGFRRVHNFEQLEKLNRLSLDVEDPLISSRVLYNVAYVYLRDAMDFQDFQSLQDAILALQNSLRDDPSYHDVLAHGNMALPIDKRINLEIALLLREAALEQAKNEEGETDEDNPGFGAGRSKSDRRP